MDLIAASRRGNCISESNLAELQGVLVTPASIEYILLTMTNYFCKLEIHVFIWGKCLHAFYHMFCRSYMHYKHALLYSKIIIT